jgi:hypothetical protein
LSDAIHAVRIETTSRSIGETQAIIRNLADSRGVCSQ